jgi:extracellular elastinolytic metalloproteinase
MSRRTCSHPLRGRELFLGLFIVLSALALALPSAGRAVVNIEDIRQEQLPDFDARDSVAPTADQVTAASALGASVSWNRFGVAASVIKHGGYLATGLQANDAVSAARNWLDANKALFRLDSTDALAVDTATPLVGTMDDYAVVFRQQADGVASTDGFATVSVVGSKDAGWKIVYASSSLTGGSTDATGADNLGPAVAWTDAAGDAGIDVSIVDVSVQDTQGGATTLAVNGLSQTQLVKKAVFATPHHGSRKAYDATVTAKGADGTLASYQVVVDAQTGAMLYRQSLVDNLSDNPTWLAFPIAPTTTPINAYPWNYPNTDTRELWCWTTLTGCAFEAQDTGVVYPLGVASKTPWDVDRDPVTGVPLATTQTTGNNVDDIQRWVAAGTRAWGVGYHATSATRDYQYPFTNAWFNANCNPSVLAGSGNDIDAAITNLFAMHNRMHDFAYYLGFDEPHWNGQQFNNGLGGLGNDGLFGNAQAQAISGGAPNYGGRDNANMGTGADGTHAQTNMFLWQPLPGAFYAPCVDGDFDMSVIGHEFGHMIENRMIGKGVGARQGTHAGAMGEAFGDFDALEYLNAFHYAPVAGSQAWTEGAYVTGNHYNAIRDFLASEPMGGEFPQPGENPKTDPLNLGDYGFDNVGPEVHADGEIWVAVEYDLRDLLLGRYPSSGAAQDIACARGRIAVDQCPGDRRWIQLYYDSMVLMARNTTILAARDAMLAADMARFGGANQDLLWQGFAQRGFGQFATTTSNGDTDPVPDFSSPLASNSTLVFNAVSQDGTPVNATIYTGDYQARVTPIADTNPVTTGPNLDETAQFVPTVGKRNDAYNFVASAPGYGHIRFAVRKLKAGETRPITIKFPTNYASTTQGATTTGDGANLANLIDDNEGTNWSSTLVPVEGRQVVVHLGTVEPVKLKEVNVSALLVPGQNRFTALRSFALYACTAGAVAANPTCDGTIDAGWTQFLNAADAFPSVNPRPVAPDMTLRSWKVSGQATHVKFVVVANQCTGQTSYQGDQDSDPNNNSDCRIGNPGTFAARNTEVHATELQVFSDKPKVLGKDVETGTG